MDTHGCGGTILIGGGGEQRHQYCLYCHAYTYDLTAPLPTGTDAVKNRRAWDAGEGQSPERVTVASPDADGHPLRAGSRAIDTVDGEWLIVVETDGERVRVERPATQQGRPDSGFWLPAKRLTQGYTALVPKK